MTVIEKKHFVCTDLEKNSNKFWRAELRSDNSVHTEYGRVGNSKGTKVKHFDTETEARKYFDIKVKDKRTVRPRRDAYTEITILGETSSKPNLNGSKHISDIAVSQIETTSPEVKDLIKWLSDINIHNIVSQTSVRYNVADGCFTTPLGVVDQSCLNQAKDLLEKIEGFVEKKNFKDSELVRLVNQYLRFVPTDLGGSSVKINLINIFGDLQAIKKQEGIIESLEAAVSQSSTVVTEEQRIFNAKMELVKEVKDDALSMISELGGKVKNIYSLEIKPVVEEWNAASMKVGNNRRLWHGTNPANALSILRCGLIISKSVNGSRFGRGLYFSDKSSMSLSYANCNRRDGKSTQLMFISDVAMGNVHYGGGSDLKEGYHSRWAEKSQSSSQIIIYNKSQCNLLYLVEVS